MKKLILVPVLMISAACARPMTSGEVKGQLNLAVESNTKAESYSDWHVSATNADSIISNLTKKYFNKEVTSKELCEAFTAMPPEDLILFENHIRKTETAFIIEPCQNLLKQKMDNHWKIEKIKLEEAPVEKPRNTSNRRFDEVIYVERDVSEGYYAISGDLLPGQVALTFDDGPSGLYTRDVLKALADANVKATFFTKGHNVKEFPNILKEVAEDGHSIGSHSNSHRCLAAKKVCKTNNNGYMLSYEEAVEDIMSGHRAIKKVLGWVHPFFRFPYGEGSPELKRFLRDSGTGEFFWSIDSNDWRAKLKKGTKLSDGTVLKEETAYSGAMMLNDMMAQLKTAKRGIILQHDIQKKTAVTLPALLNRLFDAGFQPVVFIPMDPDAKRVSDMLEE
jgi:peptidoglycan/xylan/chitin deacetylase (PgdA/CDA1 family)